VRASSRGCFVAGLSDPRPSKRIKDPALLRRLHLRWNCCALCGETQTYAGLSLHHVHKHARDDVEANLVMVCGDGTRGCHGAIEANDPVTLRLLGEHILDRRPDTIAYLQQKLGVPQADAWLERRLLIRA
jgi:5-methylcytosine-specific restriction endonuclease McrA